jgi:FdhD protein
MTGAPERPSGAVPIRLADGRADELVQEEPLLLEITGHPLLTMRTPGRDEDLATGFLLGEGIVDDVAAIARMHATPGDREADQPDRLAVHLTTAPDELAKSRLARTHEVRSSCGVCGLASAATMLDDTQPLLPGVPKIAAKALTALLAELSARQTLFAATGGSHGALLGTADGAVAGFGEDVGRHNALDKAIGQAARSGFDFARGIAVLSGRAGYDLVIKCLRLRVPVIVSVSAPSSLAFELCRSAGATLIGFARGDRRQVYCGAERL